MNNKYIYIGIAFVLAILIALYIGKSNGQKDQKDDQIRTEIKVIHVENKEAIKKVDSLNKVIAKFGKKDVQYKTEYITIKEKADKIYIEKPLNKECDELYDKATTKINYLEKAIVVKDSIEVNLRNTIALKDNIIFQKDNIIANKDKEIVLIKELNKPRVKKWAVSLQVGTGFGIETLDRNIQVKQIPIYAGVGISRDIFRF